MPRSRPRTRGDSSPASSKTRRSTRGSVYPLYGPVEYTYEETAAVLSRVLRKPVEYKQVPFDAFLAMMKSVRQSPVEGASSRNMHGELGGKPASAGESFTVQHLREVAVDHQDGIFA